LSGKLARANSKSKRNGMRVSPTRLLGTAPHHFSSRCAQGKRVASASFVCVAAPGAVKEGQFSYGTVGARFLAAAARAVTGSPGLTEVAHGRPEDGPVHPLPPPANLLRAVR